MKKYMLGMMISLLTIFLVACGNDEEKNNQEAGPMVEISEEEKVAEDEVVVVVNGEEVLGNIYNVVYTQLKLYAGQFEEEVDLEELKEKTMESIIDRQLLFQEAREEGIEITDEEAKEEIERIKTENPDALETLLSQFQLTEDGFKEQLKFELTMYEYMEKMIDVTVTDDEIEDHYEKIKEENENIPELDEIKHNLRTQMTEQKTQEELQSRIDKVREDSKIDKKL